MYLAAAFYTAMVIGTVFVTYVFVAFNLIPDPVTAGDIVSMPEIGFNWHTSMTVIMLLLTVVLYVVKRKGSQRRAEA
jgi:hypothetical protein